MEFVNSDQLKFLLETRRPFCVSIFLSTHRAGPETRQDAIRLKNLIKEAEGCLIGDGLRAAKAREILAPARQLIRQAGFWRQQQNGLALFLSQNVFQHFRVPFQLQDFVSVSETFEVSPLVPWFTASGHFYVLAISHNRVRFFHGTSSTLDELNVPGMPGSVDEALQFDVRESQLQLHSGASPPARSARSQSGVFTGQSKRATRKESAVFTGQGVGVDDEQTRTHEFLLMVEKSVRHFLKDERAPLVLAGVTELLAAYRAINKYPALLEHGITGNPDGLPSQQLHAAAWELLRPLFNQTRERALAKYQEVASSGQVASDLNGALICASHGRVETAFVADGVYKWGKFDRGRNSAEVHDQRQPGDQELLGLVAAQTILHKGTVYRLRPEEVPGGSEVAAVLRY